MSLEPTLNNFDSLIPDGIITKSNLSRGAAWYNFDINLETSLGADSIDHTYGICYQTIKEIDEVKVEENSEIHLNLNQPPNQLQHQSTVPKPKKGKLSRFSKVTASQYKKLESCSKKRKFFFKFSFPNNKACPSASYRT